MTPTSDPVVEMAQQAERALAASAATGDLGPLEKALETALEATRHFRAQLDLGGRTDVSRMLAFEALFRQALELQPKLGDVEIDGTVAARTAGVPVTAEVERAGQVRAHAFVVARAILET